MKRGDKINIRLLGERQVRVARKSGVCAGWEKRGGHQMMIGELYVETELDPYKAGGFGMSRCCLKCAGIKAEGRE